MNDASSNPRKLVYLLLITVAVASTTARIMTAERVIEPSLHRGHPKDKGRVYPEKRPKPMPTFSSNDISRWAAIRALVDEGRYAVGHRDKQLIALSAATPLAASHGIDAAVLFQMGYYVRTKKSDRGIVTESGWETVDKVLDPATLEFHSSKPPLLATLVAGLYWILQALTGWTLADHPFAVVRTIVFLINGLLFLAYLILMVRLFERFGRTEWGRYFVLAGACFGTLVTPFAITLQNHSVATFCVVFALYPAVKILDGVRPALAGGERLNERWHLFVVAGFFAAFTACNEMPAAALAVGLFGILFRAAPRRTLAFFLPAAVLLVAAFFLTNYLALGHWRPVQSEFGNPWYVYEGSHWRPPVPGEVKTGIDWARLKETKLEYAFHLLFGHHGLFSLTPLWLLAVAGMFAFSFTDLRRWLTGRQAHNMPEQSDRASTPSTYNLILGLTLALTVVVVGFYIVKSDNYGGWTCGPRWLIWLSPLWLLCALPAADRLGESTRGRAFALACLAVSVFSASFPAWNPWRHPWIYQLMEAMGWPGY